MTSPKEQQYTEIVKQAQDAMLTAFEAWTRTFQQALDELSNTAPDREHLIDQGFDFVGKLVNAQLNAQRNFTKQLTASGTAAAKTVQASAAYMTEALRKGSVL
jgi:methanogenic corrinoid protein MtbC1